MYRLLYKIKNAPRDIKRGVKSLIYWLPVIWKNNWWDSGYLFLLMHHQVKLMESHWVKDTHHVEDEEIKLQMQLCLECLKRLDEDNYILMENGIDVYNADMDILFTTLRENMRDWWD